MLRADRGDVTREDTDSRCNDMGQQNALQRLEGVVHARHYYAGDDGKQFLGAAIECDDGAVWIVDYEEQSPFHNFVGRHVIAHGEPYRPNAMSQVLVGWSGVKVFGHFCVSTMRVSEVTTDVEFVEVGPGHHLRGQFEPATSAGADSKLSFVTDDRKAFLVANDPAGLRCGIDVAVWAYPIQAPTARHGLAGPYLWVICPHSAADLWEWRRYIEC
jgi:hypothetical protein